MKWESRGLIFRPPGKKESISHAQSPTIEKISEHVIRIYYSTRNNLNQSTIGSFDFNLQNCNIVKGTSKDLMLGLGELGAFDDAGVVPGSVVRLNEGQTFLYYTGWSRTVDVPFAFHIGLAKFNGKIFERMSKAPVLGRSKFDPFIVGAPYVIKDGKIFKMWYVSCTKWEKIEGADVPRHFYTIKYAESSDGLDWQCNDKLCIDYSGDEYAIARPVVWKYNKNYHMWFSYRGGEDLYKIGTAKSSNGKDWVRQEDIGLNANSKERWNYEMICYGFPVFYKDNLFVFYNGNDYGKHGIFLAVGVV
jgi:hypothetical protein